MVLRIIRGRMTLEVAEIRVEDPGIVGKISK